MTSLTDSKDLPPEKQQDSDLETPNPPSHLQDEENTLEKSTTNKTITGTRANTFMFFTVATQLVQMIAFGVGINSGPVLAPKLGAPLYGPWIAASYPLTQGTFVLIGGSLGAVHGHKNILALGAGWWIFWTLATGLTTEILGFSFMRGLTGVGGGLMVPNAVALLGITFGPGKKRNLSLALFGAMAPVGAAGGSLVSGAFVQNTEWKWLFFFLALLGLVVFGAAILLVPEDEPQNPGGRIDWVGAYLGVAGLILFNFTWNQAPFVGWGESYEYSLLIVSILHFALFILWEAKYAIEPILPLNIWKAPSFGVLMVVLFLAFMSIGIYLWYAWNFLHTFRGFNPVQGGLAYLPLTVLGTAAAFVAGWAVSRFPAQAILGVGCVAAIGANVLLATTPVHQTYWAMIFPSMILIAFTADLIFAAAQIIASNSVSRRYQGAAGSLIGTLLTYGLSTGLGFAGTVEVNVNRGGKDELAGMRGAVYLGIGFAAAALVLNVLFIRMPKVAG